MHILWCFVGNEVHCIDVGEVMSGPVRHDLMPSRVQFIGLRSLSLVEQPNIAGFSPNGSVTAAGFE